MSRSMWSIRQLRGLTADGFQSQNCVVICSSLRWDGSGIEFQEDNCTSHFQIKFHAFLFFLIILKRISSSDSVNSESSSETKFLKLKIRVKGGTLSKNSNCQKNLHFIIWIIKSPQSLSVNIPSFKWILSFSRHLTVILCAETSAV